MMKSMRPRVFGIGLNKTGTTSLHEALTMLGLESLHWGNGEATHVVAQSIETCEPMLHRLDPRYDAFSDIESLTDHFELADQQYPGSRFILTTRRMADWLDSRERHVERNLASRVDGTYDGDFLTVDRDAWRAEWEAHAARVRDYFSSRPHDLLTIDITAGDGWDVLCPFLDRPVPFARFPHVNAHPKPTVRRWGRKVTRRLLRTMSR